MLPQMRSSFVFLFSLGLAAAQIQLKAQLFQLKGASDVNNVKLNWGSVAPGTYTIEKGTASGSLTTLATTTGDSWDDYDLSVGTTYYYRISGSAGQSSEVSVTPYTPTGNYRTYDNTQPSRLTVKADIESNGVFYRYSYTPKRPDFVITESTSTDGYTFTGDAVVLDSQTVCASIQEPCHLERTTFLKHPTTGEVVMWAHLENNRNYGLGQAASAHGTPGKGPWTFVGSSRPLGHDSRDSAFFADDDAQHSAYFLSATNVNTDLNVYKLSQDWTKIESLVTTIAKGQHREAPSLIKVDGSYYLFTSPAAGWYPSTAGYMSSNDIASGWSDVRNIGNVATWAAQSGGVRKVGDQYLMLADRWSANWAPSLPPNREYALPVTFGAKGTGAAMYSWYPEVRYQDDGAQSVYGIQAGKILSRGKKLTSTPNGGKNIGVAVDGTEDSEDFFEPGAVPFTLEVDLETEHVISAVDLTTRFLPGSETYYQFNITGRGGAAGAKEVVLADQKKNTVPGFVSSPVSDGGKYRYVKISVDKVINPHNGHDADVFRGVVELSVFGNQMEGDIERGQQQ
ncbi:Glycoside hydrolase, family 43 [Teratosphaeria destructans]|uniref:Glycoside hydrolase, family 43 n=1 Tax=Teratosphaeria destructans TaxID=418781 RepID=A0A9W7T1K3_9PEZI|nr:Glycoside hydrolase, family 43 [Teratosphaeria destructans]